MKLIKYLSIYILLINSISAFAQNDSSKLTNKIFPIRKLTTEPGIGLKPYPISDVLVSNVLQWNVKKRLSIVSYTSYTFNSAFLRNFNYIKTDYNYSLSQKIGIGTSLYSKHFSHTFSLMAGIKYDAYKETLNNPEFEKVSMSVSSVSPDFGFMYNLKIGQKKYFFSYRMYIPLYPYPFRSADINSIDGNMANMSVEFGVGMRIK
ncbi:MAG: hypothetical protein ABI723_04350 [Bacteroidia bacterium]